MNLVFVVQSYENLPTNLNCILIGVINELEAGQIILPHYKLVSPQV